MALYRFPPTRLNAQTLYRSSSTPGAVQADRCSARSEVAGLRGAAGKDTQMLGVSDRFEGVDRQERLDLLGIRTGSTTWPLFAFRSGN